MRILQQLFCCSVGGEGGRGMTGKGDINHKGKNERLQSCKISKNVIFM